MDTPRNVSPFHPSEYQIREQPETAIDAQRPTPLPLTVPQLDWRCALYTQTFGVDHDRSMTCWQTPHPHGACQDPRGRAEAVDERNRWKRTKGTVHEPVGSTVCLPQPGAEPRREQGVALPEQKTRGSSASLHIVKVLPGQSRGGHSTQGDPRSQFNGWYRKESEEHDRDFDPNTTLIFVGLANRSDAHGVAVIIQVHPQLQPDRKEETVCPPQRPHRKDGCDNQRVRWRCGDHRSFLDQ